MSTDFREALGVDACLGWPVRDEPPTVLEYVAAELWVREHYRRYIRDLGVVPSLTTWQYERFFTAYETSDPVIELAMSLLESDFRNVFSGATRRRFQRLMSGGGTGPELMALLKDATGGALKPDMLTVSSAGRVVFDAVEVGTVKTAKSTYDELQMKLDTIRTAVIPQMKLRLPALQRSLSRSLPQELEARASHFRLEPWARILPLPVRINRHGSARSADWICYHPTSTARPSGAPPGDPARPGVDGLVIYHIHRSALPELPARVRRHVERELMAWRQKRGLVLELNPAFAMTLRSDEHSWSPEARQLAAYIGVAAVVILFVAVAWEVGLIAGGVALAEGGLTALSGSLGTLTTAIAGTGEVTPLLLPAAGGALQFAR